MIGVSLNKYQEEDAFLPINLKWCDSASKA